MQSGIVVFNLPFEVSFTIYCPHGNYFFGFFIHTIEQQIAIHHRLAVFVLQGAKGNIDRVGIWELSNSFYAFKNFVGKFLSA